jgi:hypothetical protein
MAILVADNFMAVDGTAWNAANWTNGRNPGAGGGATIQSNYGQLATGTTGGYAGNDRVSRRANVANPTDIDMTFSFYFDATEVYPAAYVRTNSVVDTASGYYLAINKGTWAVGYMVAYSSTDIFNGSYSYTQGTLYKARFWVVGGDIKAKLWPAASAEPGAWDYEGSDTTYTAAGAVGFTAGGGNAAASSYFYIDDVTINDSGNQLPTVSVGADASVEVGVAFVRSATANDADGTITNYAWTVQSRPAGSVASLTGAATANMGFTPDVTGIYMLRCTVTDDASATAYDELTLTATPARGFKKIRVAGAWQVAGVYHRDTGVWQ